MNNEMKMFENPIGSKVFVISNEPYSKKLPNLLVIGEIVAWEKIHSTIYPIVNYLDKDHLVMGIIIDYHKELETTLLKLDWNERWNLCSLGRSLVLDNDKIRKEES